jgi:AAA+ ATPase superfamily predicted ATPase
LYSYVYYKCNYTTGEAIDKPADMFDRDFEWGELARFAELDVAGPSLGIVSGRRRQGKTYLLDALTRATGGFMFTATETTAAESLREFGAVLGAFRDEPSPYRFENWDEALAQLFARASVSGPLVAVLDEFPYLARQSPELPSVLQRRFDPAARRSAAQVRLLLCGSAMSLMGKLLSGGAPLRGRAALELVVPTFDFRLAARFWGIEDPRTAVLTNAVVGGTPAYRREFAQDDAPVGPHDFDGWVVRTVLNPARPLFREARYLLAEEPGLRDTAVYNSVLAAIADGNSTRGGIASYLARPATDLAHPLAVLEDAGLVWREADLLRANRSAYRIAEPMIGFYHAIMRPSWGDLERPGRAEDVWRRARQTFTSKVVGPHFERLCRDWCRWYACADTLGGYTSKVGSGAINDRSGRALLEADVVVVGQDGAASPEIPSPEILCVGEAKWNTTMTPGHLERLVRLRELLRSHPTLRAGERTRLALFSGTGFSRELRDLAAMASDVVLVGLDRLYGGE